MADASRAEMVTAALLATGAVLVTVLYKHVDPNGIFAAKHQDKPLFGAARLLFKFILAISVVVLGAALYGLIAEQNNSSSTDEPDHVEANAKLTVDEERRLEAAVKSDKATRQATKASRAQAACYSTAHNAMNKQLQKFSAQNRDSQRVIQNQTTELERSEHRADAAERCLMAKINTIKNQATFIELNNSQIDDQRVTIALQAQRIKDTDWVFKATAEQIEEKDQRFWEASGSLTVAEEELTKLRAAVADKSTTSDYCSALDAIRSRDETILALEKQLAQQAKDSEFNQETVDTLSDLLLSFAGKGPVKAINELAAWADERVARFDDFATLSGPVVIAQKDGSERLRETNDLQQRLLKNALETRNSQAKTIAEGNARLAAEKASLVAVKAQCVGLRDKDEAKTKMYNQLAGEKQHLLSALNNSQNSLQAAKKELSRRGTELATVQTELSHHMLQQAIDGRKVKMVSNANFAQNNKLATLTMQIATLNKQLEASNDSRVQEVAILNNKVRMVREALRLTGLDCDLWTIETPEELASLLEHHPSDQEAKLAETCAELSAANSRLQTDLSDQDCSIDDLEAKLDEKETEISALETELSKTSASIANLIKSLGDKEAQLTALKRSLSAKDTEITTLKTSLETLKTRSHDAYRIWHTARSEVQTELVAAKRDSRELENRVQGLQTRLKDSTDENKLFREAKYHAERKAEILTVHVADQAQRLQESREAAGREANANEDMSVALEGKKRQIEVLMERLEEMRDECLGEREEVKRLTGLLELRADEVRALERVREGLERELVLGEEFVEVLEWEGLGPAIDEEEEEEEEEGVVVQGEDVDCFGDEFEAVDAGEVDCFGDEFEAVDVEKDVDCFGDEFEAVDAGEVDCFGDEFEAVDVEKDADCFADEFEAVDVDVDGERRETVNGAPEVKVQ